MIILFLSHVSPAGWLLLLVPFPDKDPGTQRGDVTVQGKGSKRKRWSWDSEAAPASRRLPVFSITQHSLLVLTGAQGGSGAGQNRECRDRIAGDSEHLLVLHSGN